MVNNLLGRHCCLYCSATKEDIQSHLEYITERTLSSLDENLEKFVGRGSELKHAKECNNVINQRLFNIPLNQVSKTPKENKYCYKYYYVHNLNLTYLRLLYLDYTFRLGHSSNSTTSLKPIVMNLILNWLQLEDLVTGFPRTKSMILSRRSKKCNN